MNVTLTSGVLSSERTTNNDLIVTRARVEAEDSSLTSGIEMGETISFSVDVRLQRNTITLVVIFKVILSGFRQL